MKPCAKNKKRIAWLALDALDAQAAQDLRAHLAVCEGCRGYLAEISRLTAALRAAEARTELPASESFHRKVASAIRAGESRSLWQTIRGRYHEPALNWRVALPVLGIMALLMVLLAPFLRHSGASSPAPALSRPRLAAHLNSDLPPSVANYQVAANRSIEELDDLLTRQARKPPAPAPIYRASTLSLAKIPE